MSTLDTLQRNDWITRGDISGAARQNPASAVGAGVVTFVTLVALFGPMLTGDPQSGSIADGLQPPSMAHPLGTDALGRDVLTRLVYGARVTLLVAIVVTAVRLLLGFLVGFLAGLFGGLVDEILMRGVDFLLAFPGIVLALVIAGVLGPSLTNVVLALAVVGWGSYARVVRSSVMSLREEPFVDAARLAGVSRLRLVMTHFVPNVGGPVVVLATLDLGGVVLAAAGLSFLGLGAQPPTPEWGSMVAQGADHLRNAPWLVNAPGIAIAIVVLGFNLLGDGLRDALDVEEVQTR